MRTIFTKCGTYDTECNLIAHRDGSVTVKFPYIDWENNAGYLAFCRAKIPAGELATSVKEAFLKKPRTLGRLLETRVMYSDIHQVWVGGGAGIGNGSKGRWTFLTKKKHTTT